MINSMLEILQKSTKKKTNTPGNINPLDSPIAPELSWWLRW